MVQWLRLCAPNAGDMGSMPGQGTNVLHAACVCVCVLVIQSCLTLCDPMDCSPPDSSVHGILQARILEWVAIPFQRNPPDQEIKLGSPALQADS